MNKITLIALVATVCMFGATNAVSAEGIDQKALVNNNCTSTYGTNNCPVTINQNAVIGRRIHKPVNTALDITTSVAVLAIAVLGTAAFVSFKRVN